MSLIGQLIIHSAARVPRFIHLISHFPSSQNHFKQAINITCRNDNINFVDVFSDLLLFVLESSTHHSPQRFTKVVHKVKHLRKIHKTTRYDFLKNLHIDEEIK